ncbi:MAG TPA: histidine phosphatase family protein [Rhabdochlamydiaceae bacterium]|jgi:broad specificity phosphatase PhoE|nr:histidine phosphatase family protein [Rhabdochlamydiaceae bacterium]
MAVDTAADKGYCDFYFIRHLEAELPAKGKVLCGGSQPGSELDTGLTAQSKEHLEALTEKVAQLPSIAAIFSSPFKKTIETVQPSADRLKLTLILNPALDELNHGILMGMNSEEWKNHPSWKAYSKLSRLEKFTSHQIEGAESNCEAIDRVRAFCLKTAPQYLGKSVVCCSHDGAMRSLLNLATIEKIGGPLGSRSSADAAGQIPKHTKIEDTQHFENGEIFHVRFYLLSGRVETFH